MKNDSNDSHRTFAVVIKRGSQSSLRTVTFGCALLAGIGVAAADPIAIVTTKQNPAQLVGTSSMNQVMDQVLAELPLTQITLYTGLSTITAERQMEGSVNAGEPSCTPTDANGGLEGNPGCQEIAPFSSNMSSRICEDDADDPRDPNDSAVVNDTAEVLAVCKSGLAVIAHNADHAQFGTANGCTESAATPASPNPAFNHANYDETGILRNSGTLPMSSLDPSLPDYAVSDWRDVLRLIYTGCRNDQGTCSAVPRTQRCSAATNPVRAALIDRWSWIVESGEIAGDSLGGMPARDCSGTNRCTGLRKAYRRDDVSGTSFVWLQLLGLNNAVNPALTGRTRFIPQLGQSTLPPIPETHMFCDGGENEGFVPGPDGVRGDPIQKPCRPEDDICGPSGQMGVVRAIRIPQPGGFPAVQCRRGSFGLRPWLVTSQPTCPDGLASPVPGACFAPYFPQDRNGDGDTTDAPTDTFVGDCNYDCLNDANSRPIDVPGTTDGRAYNFVWRDIDGIRRDINAGTLPQTASWRENQGALDVALPVPAVHSQRYAQSSTPRDRWAASLRTRSAPSPSAIARLLRRTPTTANRRRS